MSNHHTSQKKHRSMLTQIAILFVIGVILIAALSSLALFRVATRQSIEHLATRADITARDLKSYIEDFPAYQWLLSYWYEHCDEMDIEYESYTVRDAETAEKCRMITERHPEFLIDFAEDGDVEALPPEDQKLYAEIIYSWLITHIDRAQVSSELDYFFGVVTEEPYTEETILFIAAREGDVRGPESGQIYPVGKKLQTTDEMRTAIRAAIAGEPQGAYSSDRRYYDYYYAIGTAAGRPLLSVMTLDVRQIRQEIWGAVDDFGFLFLAFLTALAIVCLLMIQIVTLRPLRNVQKSIRLYKDTKDSGKVIKSLSEVHSNNELEELSHDVIDLTKELDAYTEKIERITSERERIETELSLASRIQLSMLPSVFPAFPDRKDFDLFASMTPAKEVGGDFYDFFLVDDRHLCIVMADVSGKGIPAALFMMAAKITISHHVRMNRSPSAILTKVNSSICSRNPEEMFVTVWLGILDLKTGKLSAANAGHEYPMFMTPGGSFELIKDRHSFVLGGMDGLKYEEYHLQLEPGSKLFLYTDGLTEAINHEEEMFGSERVLEALNKKKNASAKEIVLGVRKDAADFVQDMEPFDDLTMLCLTYSGPESSDTQPEESAQE